MRSRTSQASSTGTVQNAAAVAIPADMPMVPAAAPRWQRAPLAPMAITLGFLAFTLFPPVRGEPRLQWTFFGIAGALGIWELILWAVGLRKGQVFRAEYVPVKSHWVQASVQFSIMLYWGLYWEPVYAELPLIFSEIVYVYALDALLSWSRGRTWRVGFGPLPIVISTNLLLWFKHDVYFLQFLMLTTGVLGKQFITWERDGKRTHIFNPSAFGQFLFAVGLIATGTTKDLTWGKEIAASFDTPHMLLVIFFGGLIVQYLFQVTLMTVSATVTLVLINLIYTEVTDVYLFVAVNVAAPIFLGMHLLLTDPATSPRTNLGKVIFGALYAAAYCVLFRVLDLLEIPLFWDKLLPVPILNLMVPLIDRFVRSGFVSGLNRAWEGAMPARRLNLVHMGCWVVFFTVLFATGYIREPHPGDSVLFWKQALADGKAHAGHSLVMATGGIAEGANSGAAYNELGLICLEGKIVSKNHASAAKYFCKACELRDESGCVNVAIQHLFLGERRSDEDVARALLSLEKHGMEEGSERSCFLVGYAYESGRGRPRDDGRALLMYERAGIQSPFAVKGVARLGLQGAMPEFDVRPWVRALAKLVEEGDFEACWYLAYMYKYGTWLRQDDDKARRLLERACTLAYEPACEALKEPEIPTYVVPVRVVPGWATSFPLEKAEDQPAIPLERAPVASNRGESSSPPM